MGNCKSVCPKRRKLCSCSSSDDGGTGRNDHKSLSGGRKVRRSNNHKRENFVSKTPLLFNDFAIGRKRGNGFPSFQWLEYAKAVRKLSSKRERTMLRQGMEEFRKWKKTRKSNKT